MELVGRTDEQALLFKCVKSAFVDDNSQQLPPPSLYFIYGPDLIGKTALLQWVKNEAQGFEAADTFCHQLIDCRRDNSLEVLRQPLPSLLMLDNFDSLPSTTARELQNTKGFQNAYLRTPGYMLVFTGRHEPNTVDRARLEYPFEHAVRRMPLQPLSRFDSLKQLRALNPDFKDERDPIWSTGGIPGLNTVLAQLDPKYNNSAQILAEMIDTIFNAYNLDSSKLPPELSRIKELIMNLACIRHPYFDSGLLSKMPDYPQDATNARARLGVLRHLKKSGLVIPHPEGYGFTVVPKFKPVFRNYQDALRPVEFQMVEDAERRYSMPDLY